MAKLKIGDHVNWGTDAAVDFIGVVTKVYPDGKYFDMKTNDGRTVEHLTIKDAVVTNRIVSTNAVVANALAARGAVANALDRPMGDARDFIDKAMQMLHKANNCLRTCEHEKAPLCVKEIVDCSRDLRSVRSDINRA